MSGTRAKYLANMTKLVGGIALRSMGDDTIYKVNLCAQLQRQITEESEDLDAGNWEVALKALDVARQRGRAGNRYAVDYEEAGRLLNLDKPFSSIQPGDIAYWPYDGFGHTAMYFGKINGVGYWVENTNAESRYGGRRLFPPSGGRLSAIWITPVSSMAAPRTVITPTRNIQLQDRKPAPAPAKPAPAPAKPVIIPALPPEALADALKEHLGKSLYLIRDGLTEELIGTVDKASSTKEKLYIRTR